MQVARFGMFWSLSDPDVHLPDLAAKLPEPVHKALQREARVPHKLITILSFVNPRAAIHFPYAQDLTYTPIPYSGHYGEQLQHRTSGPS